MQVQPYLFFDGRAEEAIEFYKSRLGAKAEMLMHFKDSLFATLGDGGQVQMPLAKTFFSPAFGMVADRFGVSWMVVVQQ